MNVRYLKRSSKADCCFVLSTWHGRRLGIKGSNCRLEFSCTFIHCPTLYDGTEEFGLKLQGEEQKKLDVLSNDVFINALISSGRTNVLVSEENEEPIIVEASKRGRYCVVFDPLDGSSNIDCGVSIGTIFGIYMLKEGSAGTLEDVLQPGFTMVAAGYCMYGSSCTFVLSTGAGVNGFTLDPSLGEFILTHPDIKVVHVLWNW
jgi:fructose-1,6-bisphosphatase